MICHLKSLYANITISTNSFKMEKEFLDLSGSFYYSDIGKTPFSASEHATFKLTVSADGMRNQYQ